tara:strand:- start:216 stop:671 length:456 start_codon:yes stop_codon:yes gene_type:complete
MTKINKVDLENIFLIKKELKFKNITSVKIKKGTYEIELSSYIEPSNKYNKKIIHEEEKNKENEVKSIAESKINPENIVKSPMVGVAYLSADPATPQYIKVGQHVKQGDILLLIEAMKTFNEIKAPKSGVISKIIVLNSQPVEFGNDLVIFE